MATPIACSIEIEPQGHSLVCRWVAKKRAKREVELSLQKGEPLIPSIFLIHDVQLDEASIRVELEWTFPLRKLTIIAKEADGLKQYPTTLSGGEHGKRVFTIPPPFQKAEWYRIQVVDMARNVAFNMAKEL